MDAGCFAVQQHKACPQQPATRPHAAALPVPSVWKLRSQQCPQLRAQSRQYRARPSVAQASSQPQSSRSSDRTGYEAESSGQNHLADLPGSAEITAQLRKGTKALKEVVPDLAKDAREKFWGRLAVLIFAAVVIGERITGKGLVQQLELSATKIPVHEMEPLLGAVVVFLLVAAFYPGRDKLAAPTLLRRVQKLWKWVQSVSGRLACLALAGMIVAEVTTGKGALSLLNFETGKQALNEVEAGVAFLVLLFMTGGSYKRGEEDFEEDDS